MSESPQKSSDQITSAFDAVFKPITPAEQNRVSAKQRLAPYRTQVQALRKRGYSWKQIAAGMKDPKIGEKTSPLTLKQLFGTKREKAQKRAQRAARVLPPATAGT